MIMSHNSAQLIDDELLEDYTCGSEGMEFTLDHNYDEYTSCLSSAT